MRFKACAKKENFNESGMLEYLFSRSDTSIEIIDTTPKSENQELVEDLVQIVTVFSARLQGKRANNAKKLLRVVASDDTVKEDSD